MTSHIRIRRIGILSAARVGGMISCVTGLVLGLIWGVAVTFFASLMGMVAPGHGQAGGIGTVSVIVFPLLFAGLYGLAGTVLSALVALVYNIIAGLAGGIDIELDGEDEHRHVRRQTEDLYSIY